jgi:hypothetical protein
MADGKRVALTDFIEADGVDISKWCNGVTFASEDDQVDASGFNPDGSDDIIAGKRAKSVTLGIIQSRQAAGIRQVLYPLHRDRSVVAFVWRADSNAGVGPTNPELRGNVTLPTWGEGATRGELETASLTLNSSATNPLEFYET